MSLSSNRTAPLSGAIKAPSTEIRLVLPLPDGPEMTVKTPGLSARSTSLSAVIRAAPDPKPKLTARSSTSGTEHPPGIDPQRRPRRNQRSEDAKQRERSGDDEVHPVWNGQPAHHQTQHGGEGRHDEQSESPPTIPQINDWTRTTVCTSPLDAPIAFMVAYSSMFS